MRDGVVTRDRELVAGVGAAAEALSAAPSPTAAAEVLADVATAVPGVAGATVFLFDRTERDLVPAASTVERADDRALADVLASVARDAFLAGDAAVRDVPDDDAVRDAPLVDAGDEPGGTVAARPLGGYGALAVVPSGTGPPDASSRSLLSSLATVATGQFDRIESERSVRRYTRERDRRTARLARFEGALDLALGVERAVAAATDRSSLERTVCERLASVDGVALAWIGRVDVDEGRLVPAATAGRETGYLDAVDRSFASANTEPAVVAARDREAAGVADVADGRRPAAWRREALSRDVRSVRAVPLVADDRYDGVLAVYVTDERVAVDPWRRTLDHVGGVVARGVGSLRRERALLTDAVVELELELAGGDDVFDRLARAVDGELHLGGVTARDDRVALFLSIDAGDDRSVEAAVAGDPAVASADPVRRDDGTSFEVVVREEWLLSHLVASGVRLRSAEAGADGTRVVLALPPDADVEGFVASLERRYDRVTLRSRRELTGSVAREQYVWAELDEVLTDRQLETLRTAYLSGYFAWPRESTGEDVAALLDISQPTFSRHLRTAERKLLSLLFGADEN